MLTSQRKQPTGKGIRSPESHLRMLYDTKSSKDTLQYFPDSYLHPNHGEPMDLGSDSSEDENDHFIDKF